MKNTTKKDNIKNYLLLRLNLEAKIDILKETIKNNLKNYKTKISEIQNVSLQKIDFNITLFKSIFKENNINTLQNDIFENLLRTFEYSVQQHYKENEILIKEYIKENIKNKLELKRLRTEIRTEIKEYRETNKGTINFNAAETAFVEMRRNLKEAKDNEKYLYELEEMREVAKEIIQEELKVPGSLLKIKQEEIKKPKKPKKHKFTEKEILAILMSSPEIKESIEKL